MNKKILLLTLAALGFANQQIQTKHKTESVSNDDMWTQDDIPALIDLLNDFVQRQTNMNQEQQLIMSKQQISIYNKHMSKIISMINDDIKRLKNGKKARYSDIDLHIAVNEMGCEMSKSLDN